MQNASLLRRLGAMLYDGLLVLALMFLGTLPFVALRGGEPVSPGNSGYQLTLLIIAFVFFVGFWAWHGRTLGMQSWGLRIETADGARPSVSQCGMRFFAAMLSGVALGMGFWWQLVDRDGLSWHDRLSGTRLRYYPRQAAS
ncbi:MAG: RDD family protein [Gammaproteobacteria bacterium]|nr:RDD family protein [Gammaproteobacteria bacterium]MDH4253982.1 RDD family protein [Gammaproteobacteria bacterium]MDH5308877.1 RDD family protein [Gammaproteobacteria bacterium]